MTVADPPLQQSSFHNAKDTRPSDDMHAPDGHSYRCPWIEDSITIHSDGNVTCGLDDPHGRRSFGNIEVASVASIFANDEYRKLKERLHAGYRCRNCSLYFRSEASASKLEERAKLPQVLVIEPTVRCNLRCPNDACDANNDSSIRTRDKAFIDVQAVKAVIDDVGDCLKKVYFFNYGETFVHRGAEDMLAHLKRVCPRAEVVTSTNGIPLANMARARAVVASGLDFIVFSIGGVRQQSYARYHARGKVAQALAGLKNVVAAKREIGAQKPFVHWRYLLFNWNDGDDEIEEAFALAEKIGVDDISLFLTSFPVGSTSHRFLPGSFLYSKYKKRMANALGCAATIVPQNRHGFYDVEDVGGLGHARWTGWQARKVVWDCRVKSFSLSFSTNRVGVEPPYVLIKAPWIRLRLQLAALKWRKIVIDIPEAYRNEEPIFIDILPSTYWFPIEDLGSGDMRCLGVLVREDDDDSPGIDCDLLTLMTADDAARLDAFTFEPAKLLIEGTSGHMAAFA